MNNNEKILAEFKKVLYDWDGNTDLEGQLEQILDTLPSDTEIAKGCYWGWVDSVPYDVSEMMELIALDIMKDYFDWLDKDIK